MWWSLGGVNATDVLDHGSWRAGYLMCSCPAVGSTVRSIVAAAVTTSMKLLVLELQASCVGTVAFASTDI